MNNNFFKKHLLTIIIIIIIIIIIFISYINNKNNNNKQKSELPILEQKNQDPIYEEQKNEKSQSFKKIIKVILPISSNPYESIQKWKSNNLSSTTIINESPFEWKDGDDFNLTQIVEIENIIYHINCFSDYKEKLTQWKNNCYIKPDDYYKPEKTPDKFGRYSRTIYDEKHNKLYYKYTKRWLFDLWDIYDIDGKAIFDSIKTSEHYYNTTPPPSKPDINKPLT